MNPNLAARLALSARQFPERVAIIDRRDGKRRAVTYGELAERVASTSAGLTDRGVVPGDRVLLFVPMSLDLYVALLAVLHRGAEAVFVDAWAGRARVNAAIAAANPRAWIGTPRAQLLRLQSEAVRRIPISIVAGGPWPLRRVERSARATEAALVSADTTALVTFTTGSTGQPKAAARSHGLLWAQHLALSAHLRHTEQDVDMPSLPIFVLNNLAVGITSVLPDADPRRPSAIDPRAVLANMRDEGVSTLVASPAFCERLVQEVLTRGEQLPLRRLFTGGAPVLPPLVRALARAMPHGAEVIYGSTEAEPIAGLDVQSMLALNGGRVTASTNGMDGAAVTAALGLCVGTPVEHITLRIVRPHRGPIELTESDWPAWELNAGETGEVVVAGDHVLPGYLNDPESDRTHKINDGTRIWHRTGDAGYLDNTGRLWLMGRVKHCLVRDGSSWWPLPAELRAFEVEEIAHAAYVGVGSDARAVLCVEAPTVINQAATEQALRRAVQPWPIDDVVFLTRIPRDPRHESKTDLEALLAQLSRRQPGA